MNGLVFRRARKEDEPELQAIRSAAFSPIFSAFRQVMGEALYGLVQRKDDDAQGELLASLLQGGTDREVHVAVVNGAVVGFVAVLLNREKLVGEIGLNAVSPGRANHGVGTLMYEFALDIMRQAGMKAAVASTGGDIRHAPARAAYRKAGFATEFPSVFLCREL